MKLNKNTFLAVCSSALLTFSPIAFTGCNSQAPQDANASAEGQEMEKLRQENVGLADARAGNEEVRRLRQENEELPKLRSQYQEAARLRKDNEQLRQQLAKLSAGKPGTPALADAAAETNAAATNAPAADPLVVNEGDEILIDPKNLKQLLPDIDWEKLGRKEPIGVRALLEQNGYQITNGAQLHDLGITNFIIRHAIAPPSPDASGAAPAKN